MKRKTIETITGLLIYSILGCLLCFVVLYNGIHYTATPCSIWY